MHFYHDFGIAVSITKGIMQYVYNLERKYNFYCGPNNAEGRVKFLYIVGHE
jgi:hypothetical protein